MFATVLVSILDRNKLTTGEDGFGAVLVSIPCRIKLKSGENAVRNLVDLMSGQAKERW